MLVTIFKMKNKALIDWKLTIDYTALSTTIETLAFSIEKQRAQIEDLQLHCRNNPLQNKLQDLSNTTDSRFIDLVVLHSIEISRSCKAKAYFP
jgi:hypothetical protein